MSALSGRLARRGGRIGRRLGSFASAVTAVSTKELRGRMRGRRAFVVVSIYLLLLSIFAFAIYTYLRQQATLTPATDPWWGGMPRDGIGGLFGPSEAGLSASIGHALFGGLLMVQTLLVLVLAPAFTSGAISLEREKQTLDLLVTTPLSTLGMVIGKLLSSLTYVFLLIIASIPLASVVFVFGGVGPEDLVRGYVVLFALAFGMGAIGLFLSALVRRTQTSTVLVYIVVLALTIGSFGVHKFMVVTTQAAPRGNIVVTQQRHKAPDALLWLNPFVANIDLVCATAPGSYHDACAYMSEVTGRPYFGSQLGVSERGPVTLPAVEPPPPIGADVGFAFPNSPPVVEDPPQQVRQPSLGFPRDTFWPKSAAAFAGVGLLMTLLSAQLVAPTRRLRFRLPVRRRRQMPAAVALAGDGPAADGAVTTMIEDVAAAEGAPTEKVT